jgi:hypothetical protein
MVDCLWYGQKQKNEKIGQIILLTIAVIEEGLYCFYTAESIHSGLETVMDGFGNLLLTLIKVTTFL